MKYEERFFIPSIRITDCRVSGATRPKNWPDSCEVTQNEGISKTMSNLQSERFSRVNIPMRVFIPHAWNGFCNGIKSGANIAVVIPTANCDGIEDLKNRLNQLALPPDHVFVIHDGFGEGKAVLNPDFFPSTVPKIATRMTICHTGDQHGPAVARNIGIMLALRTSSDIIAFLDDDCRPDPLWTYDIVKSFMCMPEASLLSGMTRSTGNTEYDKRHDREGTLNGRRFRGEDFLLYGPTCNLAITRKVAESILFDESYPDAACEDVDYCMKALLNGFKICHAPTMNVAHDYGYDDFSCPPEQKYHERLNRYAEGQKILQKLHPNYWKYYEMTEEIPCPTQDE